VELLSRAAALRRRVFLGALAAGIVVTGGLWWAFRTDEPPPAPVRTPSPPERIATLAPPPAPVVAPPAAPEAPPPAAPAQTPAAKAARPKKTADAGTTRAEASAGAPGQLTPAQELAFAKLRTTGLAAGKAGKWRQAADSLSKAVVLRRDEELLRELGRAYYGTNAYPSALKVLREASMLDGTDAGVFLQMGLIHQEMGNKAAACKAFGRVRELEPDSERSRELASVVRNLGC